MMLIKTEEDAKRYNSFWAVPDIDLATDKTITLVNAAAIIFTTTFTMAVIGAVKNNEKQEIPEVDKVSYVESLSDEELAALTVDVENIEINNKVYTKKIK